MENFAFNTFSPHRDDPEPPQELMEEVEQVLKMLFEAEAEKIYWRNRIKRAKNQQYEKLHEKKEWFPILEYGVLFKINLQDYLDTGLFLGPQRNTATWVAFLRERKNVF